MSTLPTEARARNCVIYGGSLQIDLVDGRTIRVPLVWYPRLLHASEQEKRDWYLIGEGEGIQWLYLDEDISVTNLLEGRRSQESAKSFRRWLNGRGG